MPRGKRQLEIDSAFDEHRNISLKLANYDEIFSVFDPRPHSERALSVDFLDEAKRASIDKPTGQIEVRLLVPKRLRDLEKERTIKRRLRDHFEKHSGVLKRKRRATMRRGSTFFISGVLIMLLTAFILYLYNSNDMAANFLLILFEPAGWFLFWEGLDMLLFEAKKTDPELEFNEKLANAHINFQSY